MGKLTQVVLPEQPDLIAEIERALLDELNEYRRPAHILMVEDDQSTCDVFAVMTKDFNIEADYALNGREGLDLAMHKSYDLVFLDMVMPGMDGEEFFRLFRKAQHTTPRGNMTPVAVVTGMFSDEVAQRMNHIGFVVHIRKPDDFSNPKYFHELLQTFGVRKKVR